MTNPMTNPPPVAPVVREYIEIGAGYVVATKGDGSTYRIHAPDDAERVIVLPEFYHPFYTQMAKAIASERAVANGELERLRTAAKLALDAFYKCVEWSGTTDFDHEIAALEAALDKLTGDK